MGAAAELAPELLIAANRLIALLLSETGDPAGSWQRTAKCWPFGKSWPTPSPL